MSDFTKTQHDNILPMHAAAFAQVTAPTHQGEQLPSGAPRDMARHILNTEYGGDRVKQWRGEWYEYNGRWYDPLELGKLEKVCYDQLEGCYYETENPKGELVTKYIVPDIAQVKRTIHALASLPNIMMQSESDPHIWVDNKEGRPPAENLIALEDGLLDITTRKLHRHTPALFTITGLDYSYDPDAGAADWTRFLESSLPGENGAAGILFLAEWFGYVLAPRQNHQVLACLVGQTGGGKGVCARMLGRLIGRKNVASPLMTSFGAHFALQGLVGKRLASFADIKDVKPIDAQAAIERLLGISGNDPIAVSRKNMIDLNVTLPVKIMLSSNRPLDIRDTSGAIARRMRIVDFTESFVGREDHGLEDRLIANSLPGILNWALDGLDRLQAQGKFTTPPSAWLEDFKRQSNPLKFFVDECIDRNPDATTPSKWFYTAWLTWCDENGHTRPGSQQHFGTNLRTVIPDLDRVRMSEDANGKREWAYNGVSLKRS